MNKKIILGIVAGIVILGLGVMGANFYNKESANKDTLEGQETEKEADTEVEDKKGILNFLEAIAGLKANNIEMMDNPVGFKGEFFAPDETIVNGLNYFLQETKNDKMENLNIKSEEGVINIKVDYKVTKTITTPIELKIKPTLDEAKDLVINIEEVKFLDLKIAKWIVNLALDNFIEDWFPDDGALKVGFNKGSVIIYKENFKGVEVKSISLENGFEIEVVVDLEKVL
ncbi:MAG: hypothetical protein RR128_04430 [Clostridium sp.]